MKPIHGPKSKRCLNPMAYPRGIYKGKVFLVLHKQNLGVVYDEIIFLTHRKPIVKRGGVWQKT